jgi:hypothetical protein
MDVEVLSPGTCHDRDLIFTCRFCGCVFKAKGPRSEYAVFDYDCCEYDESVSRYYKADCPECGFPVKLPFNGI